MQARAAANLQTRHCAARAAGARPHRPVGGRRHQAGARHRRRRGARRHPQRCCASRSARAQSPGPGRPGDRRAAAPPALTFEIEIARTKVNRGLALAPPAARRGFSFAGAIFSSPRRGGRRVMRLHKRPQPHFTAPMVRPRTMYFCTIRLSSSCGRAATIVAAAICPHSTCS